VDPLSPTLRLDDSRFGKDGHMVAHERVGRAEGRLNLARTKLPAIFEKADHQQASWIGERPEPSQFLAKRRISLDSTRFGFVARDALVGGDPGQSLKTLPQ
jgi:hypothetical protein